MQVQPSTLLLTLDQAAERAGVSTTSVSRATQDGRLQVVHTASGRKLVTRESLDQWIERRFLEAGGTDDPTKMSIQEASKLLEMRFSSIVGYIERGVLSQHRNAAGHYILDRAEFERWRHTIAPRRAQLDSSIRYYTVEEIRVLMGVASTTPIAAALHSGKLPFIRCRDPHEICLVAESDLQTWLRARADRFPQEEIRGEPLTLEQAAKRFQVSVTVVRLALRRKYIPSCRRAGPANSYYVVGSLDVEAYLQLRTTDNAWTLRRAADFLGLKYVYIRKAARERQFPTTRDRHPHFGPRRIVDPDQLMEWFKTRAISYRREASHLSQVVDVDEAARVGQVMACEIRMLMRKGRLPHWKGEIPRVHLDRWLKARRRPPSWKDPTSAWVLLPAACKETGVSKYLLRKWIARKEVYCRGKGRRRRVERCSLLQRLRRHQAPPVPPEFKLRYDPSAPIPTLTLEEYTTVQAGRLAGLSPRAALRSLSRGGYYHKVGTGRYRFPRQEIARWLHERWVLRRNRRNQPE